MRKSEHTELSILSRLAVLASENGLHHLSYGSAAEAAHLSKGALQRIFPDKLALESAVLAHANKLMLAQVFQYDRILFSSALANWAKWISGDAGLPGGCVLLSCIGMRGWSDAFATQLHAALAALLQNLTALGPQENAADNGLKTRLLAAAMALHVAQWAPAARASAELRHAQQAQFLQNFV
jgi:AcrR family transcriptional regulator